MPFQKFSLVLSSFMAISFNFYYPSGIFKRQGYGQKEKAEEGAAKRTPFLPPQMGNIPLLRKFRQLGQYLFHTSWRKFQTAEYVLHLYCFRLLELRTATFSISKEISMILAPISKIPHFLSKIPVFPAKN